MYFVIVITIDQKRQYIKHNTQIPKDKTKYEIEHNNQKSSDKNQKSQKQKIKNTT